MTDRMKTVDRRAQLVQVTLDLLGQVPLAELTTRQIAAAGGISQPGLFNHFASRDALVLAVLDHVRDQFAEIAAATMSPETPPWRAIDDLVRAMLGFARNNPGLPRLMMQDAGAGTPYRAALSHLMSMQQALFGALVRRAQRAGEVPASVDTESAGRALLAVVQGALLQGLICGGDADVTVEAGLALWWAGVRAQPDVRDPEPRVELPAGPPLVQLDVRPLLARGTDPLADVLDAVQRLPSVGALEVLVPFRPDPLIALLSARGFAVDAEQDCGVWRIIVRTPSLAPPLDLRDLPAPEPMEALLAATTTLAPGEALLARTPRVPHLLFPHLEARGLRVWAVGDDDGALVLVSRGAP